MEKLIAAYEAEKQRLRFSANAPPLAKEKGPISIAMITAIVEELQAQANEIKELKAKLGGG